MDDDDVYHYTQKVNKTFAKWDRERWFEKVGEVIGIFALISVVGLIFASAFLIFAYGIHLLNS